MVCNFSIGSLILSRRDWHQVKVPAIGGKLLYKGALSSALSAKTFPSKNKA